MTPAAKPAIFFPPISIGAAEPTMEWVELAVKEMRMRMRQPKKMPEAVGPTWPSRRTKAEMVITTASIR